MKYIIFGAGVTGHKAVWELGYNLTKYFVVSSKTFDEYCGKPVISYSDLLNMDLSDYLIVIASEKYKQEMERQLKADGIDNYFVYHEIDEWELRRTYPGYILYKQWETMTYNRLFTLRDVSNYKKIAIYSDDKFTHYIIANIAIHNKQGLKSICGIVCENQKEGRICGIQKKELCEIWDSIDCLIVNKHRNESKIFDELDSKDHSFDVISVFDIEDLEPGFSNPELLKYKDIHKGKRIWVIGNGPSLSLNDLEKLWEAGEICIGFNHVYKAYNRTNWRANYIGLTDTGVIDDCKNIKEIVGDTPVFASDNFHRDTDVKVIGADRVHLIFDDYFPNSPCFSDDVVKGVYWGCTVSYDIGLQMASYMGASEIYLLGMDNSVVGGVADKKNHFIEDYLSEELRERYLREKRISDFGRINIAFEKAEKYSRAHDFRIYNATRGGKLEAFERVDFDTLF